MSKSNRLVTIFVNHQLKLFWGTCRTEQAFQNVDINTLIENGFERIDIAKNINHKPKRESILACIRGVYHIAGYDYISGQSALRISRQSGNLYNFPKNLYKFTVDRSISLPSELHFQDEYLTGAYQVASFSDDGPIWCKSIDGSIQFKETKSTDIVTLITVIRGEVDDVKALIKEVLDETHPSYSFL